MEAATWSRAPAAWPWRMMPAGCLAHNLWANQPPCRPAAGGVVTDHPMPRIKPAYVSMENIVSTRRYRPLPPACTRRRYATRYPQIPRVPTKPYRDETYTAIVEGLVIYHSPAVHSRPPPRHAKSRRPGKKVAMLVVAVLAKKANATFSQFVALGFFLIGIKDGNPIRLYSEHNRQPPTGDTHARLPSPEP